MRIATRAALAVAAVACVAWFALGAYQQHEAAQAARIIARPRITAAQAARADALLTDAAALAPGVAITVQRSQLAQARGDLPRARALASRAAHAEPLNAEAWLQYAEVSRGTPLLRPVFRHLVSLVPPVTGR